MKRKTAKEILAESFHELSDIKDVDKITIHSGRPSSEPVKQHLSLMEEIGMENYMIEQLGD
ncbi:MAG: hypothetical protein Q4A65_09085 [Bacillota bacterium]|nr:hypothetical protein [Bacillota bacterium]